MNKEECPSYRVRLFLSVDLTGSTAFKARNGKIEPSISPNPVWMEQIRHFYSHFPTLLRTEYRRLRGGAAAEIPEDAPQIWKTIGDEIVFCCRLENLSHLAVCFSAFTHALRKFGERLESLKLGLDVKGYGWTAAFPANNVTVAIFMEGDIWDEKEEADADLNPKNYDFLGKEIDAGFRTGRYCSTDKLALSIELAYLLSHVPNAEAAGIRFLYSGRQHLKGVIRDVPYPMFCVDVERSETKKRISAYESSLVGNEKLIQPVHVSDFITAFASEYDVELPVLSDGVSRLSEMDLPPSYHQFKEIWGQARKEEEERAASEQAAATAQPDDTDDMPSDVESQLDYIIGELVKTNATDGSDPESLS